MDQKVAKYETGIWLVPIMVKLKICVDGGGPRLQRSSSEYVGIVLY